MRALFFASAYRIEIGRLRLWCCHPKKSSPLRMKTFLVLLGGALLGAAAVYVGFTRQVLVLGSGSGTERLVSINRFTGEAREVFISSFDSNRAFEEEDERMEADQEAREAARLAAKPATPVAKTTKPSPWTELPKEEIDKLKVQFRFSQGQYYGTWHNHLDKAIRIETIQAQSPAAEGREALDRIYKVEWETRALQDDSHRLEASLSEFPDGSVKLTPLKVLVQTKE